MCYRPLHDESFQERLARYDEEKRKWDAGERSPYGHERDGSFEDWEGERPNNGGYYRPSWSPGEATHFQVYETVSEGTPVTPVFATVDEMIDYLANQGTFWDQHPSPFSGAPAKGGWGYENAEAFVRGGGWMPSMVVQRDEAGVRVLEPKDLFPQPKQRRGIRFSDV